MVPQSEQLKREAEETRWQLAGTLEELRGRVTPGRVVDQLLDHARTGAASEFLRNLVREVRENPIPVGLIGIGIVWLMVVGSRRSREAIVSAEDPVSKSALLAAEETTDLGTAAVVRSAKREQQTASRVSERTSDVARTLSDRATELGRRARGLGNGAVGRAAEAASAFVPAGVETAKRPFTVPEERDERAIEGAVEAMQREREISSIVEAAALAPLG
jgi:Protein of unknown function (DUF3618)